MLKHLWRRAVYRVELLKPQVDSAGYDLVITCGSVTRHIQMKASARGGKTAVQKVHTALSAKEGGCVVWVQFDPDTLAIGPFLYFGGKANEHLPSLKGFKVARHTKANAQGVKAERPEVRVIPRSRFIVLESIEELAEVLFGRLQLEA